VNSLKGRSCLIDGEAVACDDNGLAVFERLREKRGDDISSCSPLTFDRHDMLGNHVVARPCASVLGGLRSGRHGYLTARALVWLVYSFALLRRAAMSAR
jgi:hypothetical protein